MSSVIFRFRGSAALAGSAWWAFVMAGVAWIVIGFVLLRFDSASVDLVSILFGIVLLLAAIGELLRAAMTPRWRILRLVFAVYLIVAAVIAFVNPGSTFVSLALVAGFYFVLAGTFDIVSSLFDMAFSGWWLQLLAGIAEVLIGAVASSSIASSAYLLITLVSFLSIFRGIAEISAGFTARPTLPGKG